MKNPLVLFAVLLSGVSVSASGELTQAFTGKIEPMKLSLADVGIKAPTGLPSARGHVTAPDLRSRVVSSDKFIVTPRNDADYKLLVKAPDASVDYKMIVKKVGPVSAK